MKRSVFGKTSVLCVVILFLFSTSVAFAFEAAHPVMGEVISTGKVEMETSSENWMPVNGKTFPIFDGAHLRVADGNMSLVFKDSSRVEAGKQTDVALFGSERNTAIILKNGTIGFTVPTSSQFSIKTPTASVQIVPSSSTLHKVSFSGTEKGYTKGLVTATSGGTKVMAIEGNLIVLDKGKVAVQKLSAGDAVYVTADKVQKVMQVAAPEAPAAVAVSEAASGTAAAVVAAGITAGSIGVVSYGATQSTPTISPSKP